MRPTNFHRRIYATSVTTQSSGKDFVKIILLWLLSGGRTQVLIYVGPLSGVLGEMLSRLLKERSFCRPPPEGTYSCVPVLLLSVWGLCSIFRCAMGLCNILCNLKSRLVAVFKHIVNDPVL